MVQCRSRVRRSLLGVPVSGLAAPSLSLGARGDGSGEVAAGDLLRGGNGTAAGYSCKRDRVVDTDGQAHLFEIRAVDVFGDAVMASATLTLR